MIPFTGDASARPATKQLVSTGGGRDPRWRKDGKEIFYLSNRQAEAAEVQIEGRVFKPGAVHSLLPNVVVNAQTIWDVSADGQHFIVNVYPEVKGVQSLTLIENWQEAFKK